MVYWDHWLGKVTGCFGSSEVATHWGLVLPLWLLTWLVAWMEVRMVEKASMHTNNSWVCDGEFIGWHDCCHNLLDAQCKILSPRQHPARLPTGLQTFSHTRSSQSWDASATMEAFVIGLDSRFCLDAYPLGSASNLALALNLPFASHICQWTVEVIWSSCQYLGIIISIYINQYISINISICSWGWTSVTSQPSLAMMCTSVLGT